MSKFSKRAKFLSIFAAASAVGSAGARATTIPDNKYITASVEAQNAAKFEGNINRNNFQVSKGPRFSIHPNSAAIGFVSATALGATALLIKDLFLNKDRDAINFYIKFLKDAKCNYFIINSDQFGATIVAPNMELDELIRITVGNKITDKKKLLDSMNRVRKNLQYAMLSHASSFPPHIGPKLILYANNDGKIHIINDKDDSTQEEYEKKLKESIDDCKKEPNPNKDMIKHMEAQLEHVRRLFNDRIIKEVLGDAIKQKNFQDSDEIIEKANSYNSQIADMMSNYAKISMGKNPEKFNLAESGSDLENKFNQNLENMLNNPTAQSIINKGSSSQQFDLI